MQDMQPQAGLSPSDSTASQHGSTKLMLEQAPGWSSDLASLLAAADEHVTCHNGCDCEGVAPKKLGCHPDPHHWWHHHPSLTKALEGRNSERAHL